MTLSVNPKADPYHPVLAPYRTKPEPAPIGTSRIGYLMAVQAVAVGGFRPETIQTHRRTDSVGW
jgi:hypothetical protein